MTRLTDIVEINISRETEAVAQTNFNVPLFLATHSEFSERARVYGSIEDVADDFATTSNVYIAASKLFGQSIKPANIVVGRRNVTGATINVQTVANSTAYSITVNGVAYTFTSAASAATAINIAAGIKAQYDVTPQAGVTLTDNTDGTLTATATVTNWSLTVSANLTKANAAATETWVDAIEAVQAENDTWYALTMETHVQADVLLVAAAIEAKKKVFATSSQALDIKTSVTTDLFSQLEAAGYTRTFGLWSAVADTQFPECAWVGSQLQEQPGSNIWAYKTLAGITVDTLSATESTNIKNKLGSTYEVLGGVNRVIQGKTFGNEWIDTIIFIDWLEARIRERIWFRLANSKKIPYTKEGATILETEVRAQLREGVRVGGLANDPAPTVSVLNVRSVAQNIRAQRIYEGITFEATLAGAIQYVKVTGTVSV